MNRLQLTFMWCGIIAIVFISLPFTLFWWRSYTGDETKGLFFLIFYIVLITAGLIISSKTKTRELSNLKRGLTRLALGLSLINAMVFVIIAIGAVLDGNTVADAAFILFMGLMLNIFIFIIRWVIVPIVLWIAKGFESEHENIKGD